MHASLFLFTQIASYRLTFLGYQLWTFGSTLFFKIVASLLSPIMDRCTLTYPASPTEGHLSVSTLFAIINNTAVNISVHKVVFEVILPSGNCYDNVLTNLVYMDSPPVSYHKSKLLPGFYSIIMTPEWGKGIFKPSTEQYSVCSTLDQALCGE